MESKSKEPIIMSKVRVTKLNMNFPEMWFDITFIVNNNCCYKVNIKIFKAKFNWTVFWKPNRIGILNSIDFPFL